jgi:hypothetical protein
MALFDTLYRGTIYAPVTGESSIFFIFVEKHFLFHSKMSRILLRYLWLVKPARRAERREVVNRSRFCSKGKNVGIPT